MTTATVSVKRRATFGNWKVLEAGETADHRVLCRCICSTERRVRIGSLLKGTSKSCGCRGIGLAGWDRVKATRRSLNHLRDRCDNPKNVSYINYGGRGISYDPKWADFREFICDVGPRPTPAHQIDRINNDGDYVKGNTRWVTADVQQNNRSNNVHIRHNGKTQSLYAWCEELDIPYSTVRDRIERTDDPAIILRTTDA